jgi:hypothetical protein
VHGCVKPSPYLVCGTARTGSTYLCDLLASTGVAGHPESYFRETDLQGMGPHDSESASQTTDRSTTPLSKAPYRQARVPTATSQPASCGGRWTWSSRDCESHLSRVTWRFSVRPSGYPLFASAPDRCHRPSGVVGACRADRLLATRGQPGPNTSSKRTRSTRKGSDAIRKTASRFRSTTRRRRSARLVMQLTGCASSEAEATDAVTEDGNSCGR